MNYHVKISAPNKVFVIKNIPIRSPFRTMVDEKNLLTIQSRIKFYGLNSKDYEITPVDKYSQDYNNILSSARTPDKENRQEKILNVASRSPLPQETKNLKQEVINYTPKYPMKKKTEESADLKKISEQIIKDNSKLETDVKIEELTVKSSSILDRILKGENF